MHASPPCCWRRPRLEVIILLTAFWAAPAAAVEATVGFGLGVAPEYVGAGRYLPVPLPSVSLQAAGITSRSNNFGLEAGLPLTDTLSAGVIFRIDSGRNALFRVSDPVVRQLRRVNAAPEVGGYLELQLPMSAAGPGGPLMLGRIAAEQGIGNGHGGLLVETSLGVLFPLGDRTVLGVSALLNWQDRRYADAFFGIDADDAAASGLAPFTARAGVRDLGIQLFLERRLSARWSAGLTGSYTRLRASAAASPIVAERGNVDQVFAGLSATYSF